jgi:hypothetical protein
LEPERRRRGIFVEPGQNDFQAPSGAASPTNRVTEYAAPAGLKILLVLVFTKISLLTELAEMGRRENLPRSHLTPPAGEFIFAA